MTKRVTIDTSNWDFAQLSEQFKKIRENISAEILDHINRLADIREFLNCETYFHSKRQMILEDIHTYMDTVLLLQSSVDQRKSEVLTGVVYSDSTNSMAYKSKDEKLMFVNGDQQVLYLQQYINLFNNQIMFLNESKKTIEGVIYNMKYRFEIQKEINVC